MLKYTLSPKRANYSEFDDASNTRVSYGKDGEERVTTTSRGMVIMVDSSGEYGVVSFYHLLMVIVICSAVLAYGKLFVNYVLTMIYLYNPCSRDKEHVGVLHQVSVYEYTPTEEEMRTMHLEGQTANSFR